MAASNSVATTATVRSKTLPSPTSSARAVHRSPRESRQGSRLRPMTAPAGADESQRPDRLGERPMPAGRAREHRARWRTGQPNTVALVKLDERCFAAGVPCAEHPLHHLNDSRVELSAGTCAELGECRIRRHRLAVRALANHCVERIRD